MNYMAPAGFFVCKKKSLKIKYKSEILETDKQQ